ncbi:phage tail tape measure protein [Clostridium baratii]|uniref:phage tail tape measure protein n=1 Tax=Clostridium baratii TaxID=1561 RepID=UPI0030D1E258
MADGRVVIDTDLSTKEFEKGINSLGSVAKKGLKVVSTAAVGAATAVGGMATAAIKVGSNFESGMSQVAATMGITTQEINNGSKSYEMLKQAAKDAGATTQFSATQSAEALNYLALAGYDAEKSVKALPTVLNLAAAGGLDLGYASDLVTDSMSALGLETNQLEGFVDQLAKTSQKSNTSVAQLGEAILTVGGTAKVLKGGTVELNTALGILADNGIKGAEGGTALRNVILSLSAPTDKAAATLKQLGIQVLDAQGNMRPLNEIFGDLNSKLTTMSQGEQTQVLNKIFNKVDLKSVNALLANSGERFNQLSGAIEQSSGAAANMAETMNDNLKGKITILGSSLEGLGIQIYEKMEKPLKKGVETAIESVGTLADRLSNGDLSESVDKLAENFGNLVGTLAELIAAVLPKLIDGLNWLMDNGPIITTIIAGFAGSFAVLKTAIAVEKIIGFAKTLGSLKSGLDLATISTKLFNSALLANPIVLIVTLIGGLVAALVWLWNTNDDFRNFWIGVWESIKEGFINCWNAVVGFFTETIPQAFDNLIQGIIEWKNNIIQYFSDLYNDAIESVIAWKDGVVQYFKDMYNNTKQGIIDWAKGVKESFIQWKNDTIDTIKGWGENISNFFTETIPAWIESIGQWFSELPSRIGHEIGLALAQIYLWGENVWNFFTETIPMWIESIGQWFSELPGKIANWLSESYNKFIEWKEETKEVIKQWFIDSINSFTQWVSDTYDKFIQWKEDTKEAIKQWASDMVTAFSDWISETYNKVSTWASNMCSKAAEMASNFIDSIINWFKQLPGRMWNWLVNAYHKVVNWGKDLWNAACDAGKDLMNGIIDTIKDLPNRMLSIGKDIVRGLWEGIKSMGSWLWGGVTDFVGGIVDGFKEGLGIHSPSRVMKKEVGRWIPPGISEGIEDEMPNLQRDINTNISDLTSKMKMTVNYETAHTASRITSNANNDVISRRLENKENEEKIPVNLTIVNKNYLDSEEIAEHTTPIVIDNINDDQQSYIIAQGGYA